MLFWINLNKERNLDSFMDWYLRFTNSLSIPNNSTVQKFIYVPTYRYKYYVFQPLLKEVDKFTFRMLGNRGNWRLHSEDEYINFKQPFLFSVEKGGDGLQKNINIP